MALLKIKCPECRAGLKSATGFAVGQTVCCPKCETYFAVEEPEDEDEAPRTGKPAKKAVRAAVAEELPDDEDEEPRKKRKKRRDDDEDEERSYKNSPLRYVILGVLIAVMLVLGYLLYEKKKSEREDSAAPVAAPAGRA